MTENKLCIADQIGNYIKYAFDNVKYDNSEFKQRGLDKALYYYKELRGELLLNGQNPKGVASGVVYVACKMVEWEMLNEGKLTYKTRKVPMIDVADIFNCSQVSVRKYSHLIRRHFRLG